MLKLIKHQFVNIVSIAAILTGSLAPTLAQASSVASIGKSFTTEICSSTGIKLTHLVVFSSQSEDSHKAPNHCPYCVLSDGNVVFINSELSFSKPQDIKQHLLIFYRSPRILTAWVNLPSRAPPLVPFF